MTAFRMIAAAAVLAAPLAAAPAAVAQTPDQLIADAVRPLPDDLKAKMLEALAKKQAGHETAVGEDGHHKEKGPHARGRQGGSREFRRKAGG